MGQDQGGGYQLLAIPNGVVVAVARLLTTEAGLVAATTASAFSYQGRRVYDGSLRLQMGRTLFLADGPWQNPSVGPFPLFSCQDWGL